MNYLSAFIKETLRMFPPVAMASPKIPIKKMKIGNIDIDENYEIFCCQIANF